MAKAKKKSLARPASRPPLSLPPEVLEEAAQGWLQSHGVASPQTSSPALKESFQDLTEGLAKVLHEIRRQMDELEERISRLEKTNR
jgi:Mg2+ and Co2+ transporter CorA